jgi:hypothetical protein
MSASLIFSSRFQCHQKRCGKVGGKCRLSRFSFFSQEKNIVFFQIFVLFVISISDTNGISALWAQKDPTDFEMKHYPLKLKNQEYRRVRGGR